MIISQSPKHEYFDLVSNYFKGFKLQFPLYLNWHIGMRFDLQIETDDTDVYFKEVLNRANILYNSIFNPNDEILVLIADGKITKKRNRIRANNYFFKQIENLNRKNISYFKLKNLYSLLEPSDYYEFNVAVIKCNANQVNQLNILKEKAYGDFNIMRNSVSRKEVFFINLNKKIMFNMYDDRGLDIIASDKEILRHLYIKHNNLILDYNRKEIDSLFK